MRSAAKTCQACPNLRLRQHVVCSACWRRLPVDLRNALTEARHAQAFARAAEAGVAAVAWLRANPPSRAIARVTGEADLGALPP